MVLAGVSTRSVNLRNKHPHRTLVKIEALLVIAKEAPPQFEHGIWYWPNYIYSQIFVINWCDIIQGLIIPCKS
jgi:hypothetical protein